MISSNRKQIVSGNWLRDNIQLNGRWSVQLAPLSLSHLFFPPEKLRGVGWKVEYIPLCNGAFELYLHIACMRIVVAFVFCISSLSTFAIRKALLILYHVTDQYDGWYVGSLTYCTSLPYLVIGSLQALSEVFYTVFYWQVQNHLCGTLLAWHNGISCFYFLLIAKFVLCFWVSFI